MDYRPLAHRKADDVEHLGVPVRDSNNVRQPNSTTSIGGLIRVGWYTGTTGNGHVVLMSRRATADLRKREDLYAIELPGAEQTSSKSIHGPIPEARRRTMFFRKIKKNG